MTSFGLIPAGRRGRLLFGEVEGLGDFLELFYQAPRISRMSPIHLFGRNSKMIVQVGFDGCQHPPGTVDFPHEFDEGLVAFRGGLFHVQCDCSGAA